MATEHLRVLGVELGSDVTPEDLAAAADAAFFELRDRGADPDGVSPVVHQDVRAELLPDGGPGRSPESESAPDVAITPFTGADPEPGVRASDLLTLALEALRDDELRQTIADEVEAADDGRGAKIGAVIQRAATEPGTSTADALLEVRGMLYAGELYEPETGRFRLTVPEDWNDGNGGDGDDA